MKYNPFNKTIGLALGGGGAKGLAHIGVIKAIKEKNIPIDFISGTSVGSIIASYYAFDKDLNEISNLSDKLNSKKVISLNFAKQGLASTKSIRNMLLNDIGDVLIEDASIPLAIVTTDIHTGESCILTKGSLLDAVCASVAVPGLFQPVKVNGRLMVDGGLTENVPVNVLEQFGAGITIGVNLNGESSYPEVSNIIDVISNSLDIAINYKTQKDMKKVDIPISLDLGRFSKFDNSDNKEELISLGYDTAMKQIHRLQRHYKYNFLYSAKLFFKESLPIKMPELLKKFLNWYNNI